MTFFPARQRHVNIKDVSFSLIGGDGQNKSILCPLATTIELLNAV